jgi:NTE family protein
MWLIFFFVFPPLPPGNAGAGAAATLPKPAFFYPPTFATPSNSLRDENNPAREVIIFRPRLGRQVEPPACFLSHCQLARPQLGLALSGGGARALSHIGVLQAIEEHGIPIDFIVGTSMGSIVGGLYAAGYSATQLREIAHTIPWSDITVDTPPRTSLFLGQKQERDRALLQIRFKNFKPYIPPALTAGQKLLTVLSDLTMRATYGASGGFDHLRIPFRAVATDLHSGEAIAIGEGDLAEAMRASTAVPFLFAPLPSQGRLLADGGLVNNIPVDVARQRVDFVIAVDATSKLRPKDDLASPWEMADQLTTIMQRDRNEAQRQNADVLITIEEKHRTSSDFSAIDSLIDLGYQKTMEQMTKIRLLIGQSEESAVALPEDGTIFSIDHAFIKNSAGVTALSRWELTHQAHAVTAGKNMAPTLSDPRTELLKGNGTGESVSLSSSEIQQWVEKIYATGDYAAVHAELRMDSLMLVLKENPRLQQVRFTGNTVYHDSTLFACIRSTRGEAINHQRSYDDLTAIVEHYRRDGYALAEINSVLFDSSTGVLQIDIDEGRIAEIEVSGLGRTQKIVVLREFPQKAGDILNSNLCRRGTDDIYNTGLFDQVVLNTYRRQTGAIVNIKVQEKPFTVLRLGGHYDSERYTKGFLEIGDENLLGLGSKLFAYGEIGSRDLLTRLSWRSDRILRTYVSISGSAYYQKRENFVYQPSFANPIGEYLERRTGLHIALGPQLHRLGVFSVELRLEEVELKRISGFGYPTDNLGLSALVLRSIVDTLDRLPFPRRGRYAHIFYETVYTELGARDSFFRLFARLESYHSRGPHTIRPKFSIGASDQTTPFSEQFRLGGPEEVYGLRDQELIGRHFALFSFEYRYQIRRRPLFDSYLSLRYDYSGLWIDKRDVNYRKFRHAFGVSYALDTPLGPIGIAYGMYDNRQQRFYVNIGYKF